MSITIDANAHTVAADVRADMTSVWPRVRSAVQLWTTRVQQLVASEKLSGGGILEPRTGNLRRSLFTRIDESDGQVIGTIGFDLSLAPYGRIQELGGTISAKNAANLTIPIGEALTAKGVARFTARDLIANPQQFGFDGTFVAKGVLFGTIGRLTGQREIVPLFVLKPSVTLPPREPLASALADLADQIVAGIGDAVAAGGAA